jgi:MFS family permease
MKLLRQRDFQLILVGVGLSSLGDYLALLALTLEVWDSTGSGWAVSGLLLTGLAPQVLFAPLAGWLVDRRETVRVLVLVALLQAATAAALAFVNPLAAIYALSLLLGTGVAVAQPGLMALVPRVAGEDRVTEANAYLSASRWGGAALGPVLGGVLSGAIGTEGALLADAGSFLLIAGAIGLLRVRRPPEPAVEGAPKERARDGFGVIWHDGLLRLATSVIAATVLFAVIDNVAEVFYATEDLGAGEIGYGLLVGSWTTGMVAGSTLIGRRLPTGGLAWAMLLAGAGGGTAVLLAAAVPVLAVAIVCFLAGGVANGVVVVAYQSLIPRRVEDRLRGRAFAAFYGIVNAAQVTAMAMGGGLVDLLGGRGSLAIAGGGAALASAIGLLIHATMPAAERTVAEPDIATPDAAEPGLEGGSLAPIEAAEPVRRSAEG